MFYEEFHAKVAEFASKLYEQLGEDPNRTWARMHEETYNHKRVTEISVWHGTGEQEMGHVFLMKAGEWDGKPDWDRIMAIVGNDEYAIKFDQPSKVWNLAMLETQTEPSDRCKVCGKSE